LFINNCFFNSSKDKSFFIKASFYSSSISSKDDLKNVFRKNKATVIIKLSKKDILSNLKILLKKYAITKTITVFNMSQTKKPTTILTVLTILSFFIKISFHNN